ncbi:MAG: Fe-S-containing protein [bacterium]
MFRRFGILIALLLCALLLTACGSKADTTSEQAAEAVGLTIDAATLTGEPTFIDVEQDGTAMQLIARKDDAGTVRLAFNTCQSCGGSPYAWFEELGNGNLQCQNCGLTFPLDTVGTEKAAGCNPVTITDFTVEGDTVTVSEALLKANVERFANWKKFD